MKTWFVGSAVTLLLLLFSIGAVARPGKFKGYERFDDRPAKYHEAAWNQERNDARYIIHRTATVIFSAQRAAARSHRFTGLGQAVAHQQTAWELYGRGDYRNAIFHSLRARNIAFQIITVNRAQIGREYYRDEMEDRYAQRAPRDNQLDFAIESVKIGNDSEAVHFSLHLDIAQ